MRRRGERGAVTAELAMAMPLLVALTVCLVWLLSVASAQVRVVDASREGARVLARGDDESSARALAERIAPAGARVELRPGAEEVVVVTTARVRPPLRLLGHLGTVTVRADAVAVVEEE